MKIPYFDAHCDTIGMGLTAHDSLRRNSCAIDLERGQALDGYAQIFALYGDVDSVSAGQMWDYCRALYGRFREELAKSSELMTQCRSGVEIDAAVEKGLIAALLSIESADLLECRIERIETVAQWGARLMNLTWNQPSILSGTNCREGDRGLSAYGREFVRELESNEIYADVSHLSDAGFWDVIRMARRPVVASHSNARALCPHSRNLTDDMFCAIRDSGGVVGINYYRNFVGGNGDVDALVAHIEHFLSLNGEKTLCFGGDMDGCSPLIHGVDGLQDVHKIYKALRLRGYGETLLEDLFWNNLRRLF